MYQSSPLNFFFNGAGPAGFLLWNREFFPVIYTDPSNFTFAAAPTRQAATAITQQSIYSSTALAVQQTIGVLVRWFQGFVETDEYYLLSSNGNGYNPQGEPINSFDFPNQVFKGFSTPTNNLSLATREAQLLSSFVQNRQDLFTLVNGKYVSKKITFKVTPVKSRFLMNGVYYVVTCVNSYPGSSNIYSSTQQNVQPLQVITTDIINDDSVFNVGNSTDYFVSNVDQLYCTIIDGSGNLTYNISNPTVFGFTPIPYAQYEQAKQIYLLEQSEIKSAQLSLQFVYNPNQTYTSPHFLTSY